jgi:hypothetical protein
MEPVEQPAELTEEKDAAARVKEAAAHLERLGVVAEPRIAAETVGVSGDRALFTATVVLVARVKPVTESTQ